MRQYAVVGSSSSSPGFITDARLDGPDRIVTFFTGTTLREVLVDLDDDARRLAWSIVDAPYTHHNGVAQVVDGPDGRTRFVWVTDLLPNEIAERTAAMMDRGLAVIKETLEGVAAGSLLRGVATLLKRRLEGGESGGRGGLGLYDNPNSPRQALSWLE